MDIEDIRLYCLQFPHTAEIVQWGADLCFKVDGKLFVVAAIEMVPPRLSFKCTPEKFAELCERTGIIPPYRRGRNGSACWASTRCPRLSCAS